MSDLIRRETVIDALLLEFPQINVPLVQIALERISAVDAVEVVRCKDCEHAKEPGYVSQRYGEPGIKTCKNPKSMANRRIVMPYDFCPYGERREENGIDAV